MSAPGGEDAPTARTLWRQLLAAARRGTALGEVVAEILASPVGFRADASPAEWEAEIAAQYQIARAVVRPPSAGGAYREQLQRLGEIRFSGPRGPSAVLAWRAHLYSASIAGDARRGAYAVLARTLARRALMSRRTLSAWTQAFIRAGWITRLSTGRKGRSASVYRINLDRAPLLAILAAGDARSEEGRGCTDLSDNFAPNKALIEENQGVRRLPDATAEGSAAVEAAIAFPPIKLKLNAGKIVREASFRPPRRRPYTPRSRRFPTRARRVGRSLRDGRRENEKDDARKPADACLLPAFGNRVPLAPIHRVWRRFPGHLPYLLWSTLSATEEWRIGHYAPSDQRRLRRALGALRDAGLAKQTPAGGWLRVEHADLDELDRALGHRERIRPPREAK